MKSEFNIYSKINNINIFPSYTKLNKLCNAQEYTELIDGNEYKKWTSNLKIFKEYIYDLKIGYNKSKLDSDEIQNLSDLTGKEIIYDFIYIPTSLKKSMKIFETRNFLCKNLSGDKLLNSLKLISKYNICENEIDFKSVIEDLRIKKILGYSYSNNIDNFNLDFENTDILEYTNFMKFYDLKIITKILIMLRNIEKLYGWIIKNAHYKSLKTKILEIINGIKILNKFLRILTNEHYENTLYNINNELLLNIEQNLKYDQSGKLYILLRDDTLNIFNKSILDNIGIVDYHNIPILQTLNISFDINKNFIDLTEFHENITHKELNKTLLSIRKSLNISTNCY